MTEERWRPIKEFPGYEVSDLGRVRSSMMGTSRILKPTGERGRTAVFLYSDGKPHGTTKQIARLVLEAFTEEKGTKAMVTEHLDGDIENNALSNIRWVSRRDTREARAKRKKVKCVETKAEFESLAGASRELGIDVSNINNALAGRRKKAGGYTWKYIED